MPEDKMKIAVATNNQQTVTGHIGRCKGFNIYETDDSGIQNKEFRENTFTHHRQGLHQERHHHGGHGGGHGHNRLIEGIGDCKYLIFQSGGWRIIEDLKTNNIQPILTDEKNADEAVQKFLKGELKLKKETGCREQGLGH
jgi:predicted Fe-Mo cluster-binding NifX family protein